MEGGNKVEMFNISSATLKIYYLTLSNVYINKYMKTFIKNNIINSNIQSFYLETKLFRTKKIYFNVYFILIY